MGNICVDAQGTLLWLINPEFHLYRVELDGTMKLFAQNLPIDPGAGAVDSQRDVYFTTWAESTVYIGNRSRKIQFSNSTEASGYYSSTD